MAGLEKKSLESLSSTPDGCIPQPLMRGETHDRAPGSLLRLVFAAALFASPACTDPPDEDPLPPARSFPAGTAVAVNGDPVLAEEIQRVAASIQALYPGYTDAHHRRLALTAVVLPRAAIRSLHREAHARARAEAARALERGPDFLADLSKEQRGNFKSLDLDLWCLARELPLGEWRGPLELVGRFALVRLDARHGANAEEEVLELRCVEFAFVPLDDLKSLVEAALDRSRLEIVDPEWEETVPEAWKRRMNGEA